MKLKYNKIGKIGWTKSSSYSKQRKYRVYHIWLNRNGYKKYYCELCNRRTKLELSNISGEYYLNPIDYWTLCKDCHLDYDWWLKYGFNSNRKISNYE